MTLVNDLFGDNISVLQKTQLRNRKCVNVFVKRKFKDKNEVKTKTKLHKVELIIIFFKITAVRFNKSTHRSRLKKRKSLQSVIDSFSEIFLSLTVPKNPKGDPLVIQKLFGRIFIMTSKGLKRNTTKTTNV